MPTASSDHVTLNLSPTLSGLPFRKMNGLGNDFVVLDLRQTTASVSEDDARAIADRDHGIGCDQVVAIEADFSGADAFMRIWNADGGEVAACGNAARCVGWLLLEEAGRDTAAIRTSAETLCAVRAGAQRVTVDMGPPRLDWASIPLSEPFEDTRFIDVKLGPIDNPVLWGPSAVSMGNPHCIFFVEDAEAHALERFGPMVENHPLFPERTNVEIAEVQSREAIRLRVWERGAGITKACGTGACATLVAAVRRRLADRRAVVALDGGELDIEWREDGRVYMTGDIAFEFDGVLGVS
ncbi:MAG: diaminopimelate epimerase [Pseudomonadota bacterium]